MSIVRMSAYQRVLNTVNDELYEWGWEKVEDLENVDAIRYENDWVSNVVAQKEVKRMVGDTPLFIVSQTGTGKTTFIFEKCLPVAEEEGRKVLYLCNRAALKNQIKKEAMKNKLNRSLYVDGLKIEEYNDYLTSKGIEKEHRFGLIDVYTYQEMINFPKEKVEEYAVVVMDEAHFFISDAKFNPYTEVILDKIVNIFKDTRRIYLSATPQESLGVICEVERSYHVRPMNPWERMYSMYGLEMARLRLDVIVVDEDYHYLQPRFFENVHELQDVVLRNSQKKWLIFIREKGMAVELTKELKLAEEDVAYYDADTDKELERYKKLIENEELTHRVTISTKVFDVGINIKTENVNMVIFEDDPIEIKQMVGRKRIKPEEKVTVYFYVPTIKELNQRKGRAFNEIIEFQNLQANYQKKNYDSISAPLYILNGKVQINYYYQVKTKKDYWRYEGLIEKMMEAKRGQEKYVYADYILQQFHLKLSEVERYFCGYEPQDAIEAKLKECLSSYLEQEITKEGLNDVAINIFKILPDPRKDKRSDRNVGIVSINKVINAYGYRVESVKKSGPVSYKITLTDKEGENDV